MTITELKLKIKDQEVYITGLKYKIKELQHQIDNFESYQREKCCECEKKAVQELSDTEFKLFQLKEKIGELIK